MENLIIDTLGKIPGGAYDRVEVDGILTAQGALSANRMEINGVMKAQADLSVRDKLAVDGALTAEGNVGGGSVEIDGVATVRGDLSGGDITVDGALTAEGNVTGDIIEIDGVVTVNGSMKGREIRVDGSFVIRGEKLEADSIQGDGVITVTGEVNADEVNIDGVLRANEIFGDHVVIEGHRHAGFWKWLSGHPLENSFRINLIEATRVELGDLAVAEISAQTILLHAGCVVDRVYCTQELVIEDDARVGEISGNASVTRR